MIFENPKPTGDFRSALATFEGGDAHPLTSMGIPRSAIDALGRIMDIYSFHPPPSVETLLVRVLASPLPADSLLRIEGIIGNGGYFTPDFSAGGSVEMIAAAAVWSDALSRRLGGDPGIAPILAAVSDPFSPRMDARYYLERFRSAAGGSGDLSSRIRAVHRAQTAELVRILARNADPSTPISEINAELSALADAAVEECLAIAVEGLSRSEAPAPPGGAFVVMGLGKLGGGELNVSSDIDLIYLYEERSPDGDENVVGYTRLAERLTRSLSEATESGALYRVDTRLRADGASGPLVRSMQDYFRYLEMRGEAWERQMLLKARPVAGDIRAGAAFLRTLDRFVFPASMTRSPNREIASLKAKIESRLSAEGSKGTHLKLRPGGIRDIEFIVQCLQLLTGGTHEEVRAAGTLPALDALRSCGTLSEREHGTLSEAYILFRRVENILQWRELSPAFTLPGEEGEFDVIASFLGYDAREGNPGARLRTDLDRDFGEVRAIFDEIFADGGTESFGTVGVTVAFGHAETGDSMRYLETIGFPDPERSARTLARLFDGVPGGGTSERFAAALLEGLAGLPDPGGALERFTHVVEAYNARKALFDVLDGTPKLLELLLLLAHSSVFLTDIITGDPSLLDWLIEGGELLAAPNPKELAAELRRLDHACGTNEAFSAGLRALKNREELRIGARAVSGISDTPAAFEELTSVAERAVEAAVSRAVRLSGRIERGFAFSVMAAGRLGAGIMDFGSDLDLIFVHRGGGDAETAVRLARTVVALLVGGGGPNKSYDIDTRLRPEGGNSPLSVSFEEYRRYLETRASEWERPAMVPARPVAGNARLGRETAELLDRFVRKGRFSGDELGRIMDIRNRAADQSRKRHPGLVNVKSGSGGLSDIDFIARTFSAHYGAERPGVLRRTTGEILAALASERLMDRGDARFLIEAYRFLSDAEFAVRIGTGRSVNTIPPEGVEAGRIARLLGSANAPRLVKKVMDVMSATGDRFNRLMEGLREDAGDSPKG